jgi:hypothetical protein
MSIEATHLDKIKELTNNEGKITDLKLSLNVLQRKRDRSKNKDIFTLLELDNDIYNQTKRINDLNLINHNDYLLKVSGILNEYSKETSDVFSEIVNVSATNKNTMCGFVQQKTNNRRGQLFNKYMNMIDDNAIIQTITNNVDLDVFTCTECKNVMKLSVNESYIVCDKCGHYETYFEPSMSGLTYEQEINTDTNVHFAYKRINHLRELLSQLQAKENSDVPDDILQLVRAEFIKARIRDVSEITQEKVKYYLKKLNLNKFYEHARQITNILNGKPPPCISGELYEKLINMFTDIQEPFERVCPKNRKNFFSYNYILYKFCELLNEVDLMTLFPLLKSREKLYQQDCIWKNICIITDWPFYKSV